MMIALLKKRQKIKMDEGKLYVSYDHAESMSDDIHGGIPVCDNAKRSVDAIGQKFKESDKAQTERLMNTLTTLKCEDNNIVNIFDGLDIPSNLNHLELTSLTISWFIWLSHSLIG